MEQTLQQACNHAFPEATHQTSTSSSWSALLSGELRDRTLDTVALIAERLGDPDRVATIAERARTQSDEFFWSGASLASSFSSLALLYRFLARSFPEQEDLAQRYLLLAARATEETPLLHPGMFSGSAGFALLLSFFYQDEPRYQRLFKNVCGDVLAQVREHPALKRGPLSSVPNTDYEVISGVSGMLAFLTALPSPTDEARETIQQLLEYLVWLCGKDEDGRAHWFVLSEYLPAIGSYRHIYPNGYFNLGLSHGIPGPLAALALAWQAGYRVSGQREAMIHISRWLLEHQSPDGWGINWASGIPVERAADKAWRKLKPTRAAWCYGAPGIAAALWSAGRALADPVLQQVARIALETALSRPPQKRQITSPTLCHGVGGLLAICLRFAQFPEGLSIREHIPALTTQILDACSPNFLLGVRDETRTGEFVDDPGFLTGAAGVALALLAAATPVEPQWDRALLLA